MATTRMPTWKRKSDEELAELVRAVWEGRAIGSWHLSSYAELERVFPGYQGFEVMAGAEAAGAVTYFSNPDAARSFSRVPMPAAAYGPVPAAAGSHPSAPSSLPVIAEWEMLSHEEWKRIREMLGYAEPPKLPKKSGDT